MSADLIDLVQRLGQPRVLVVGDLMLDRYVWGDAERISQEAPVILLRADQREERLGGASSVATMLRAWAPRSPWPASSAPTPTAAASASCSPTWASIDEAVSGRRRPAQHGQGALHRPGAAPPSATDDPRRLRGPRAAVAAGRGATVPGHRPADAPGRHRPDQRLRQGRLHARAAGGRHRRRRARGLRVLADPIRGQRLPQVSRLLGDDAQPLGSRPGHRPTC